MLFDCVEEGLDHDLFKHLAFSIAGVRRSLSASLSLLKWLQLQLQPLCVVQEDDHLSLSAHKQRKVKFPLSQFKNVFPKPKWKPKSLSQEQWTQILELQHHYLHLYCHFHRNNGNGSFIILLKQWVNHSCLLLFVICFCLLIDCFYNGVSYGGWSEFSTAWSILIWWLTLSGLNIKYSSWYL